MSQNTFLSRISRLLLPIAVLVVAVLFLSLMSYAVPAADDFCKASLSYYGQTQHDVFAVTWKYYWGYSPRWMTILVQSLVMSSVDLLVMYSFLLLLVMISNVAALWYFFKKLLDLDAGAALFVAALFYAGWLAAVESPAESVFWLNAAIEYQLPLSLLLVLVTMLLFGSKHSSGLRTSTLMLLSVVIPAQHELAGTFLCVLLMAGIVMRKRTALPTSQWLLCLGLVALSLTIFFASPGNRARAASEGIVLWDIGHSLSHARSAVLQSAKWLSNPTILLLAFGLPLFVRPKSDPSDERRDIQKIGALACVIGLSVVVLELAFTQTVTGFSLPARAIGSLQFIFWLFLVGLVFLGMPELSRVRLSEVSKTIAVVLLSVSLVGSHNVVEVTKDLARTAGPWRNFMTGLLTTRATEIDIDTMPTKPKMFFDVGMDSLPWVNRCAANYMGVDTIIIKGRPLTKVSPRM